jgi:hypothetical protein
VKLPKLVSGAALAAAMACGGGSPSEPGLDLSDAVPLPGGSTLVFEDQGQLGERRDDVERLVRATLEKLPLEGVTVLIRIGTDLVIPEIGFGGRADAGTVFIQFDSGGSLWESTLESEFPPLFAHELHHVARLRAVGFNEHLLDALVAEGLADQFSVELLGVPPPLWAVALTGSELELWAERARDKWFNGDYNHAAWFFGTGSVPRWAGYAIGFRLTGDYLASRPGTSAASLHAEPSESFAE